jgi:hypothetical protein
MCDAFFQNYAAALNEKSPEGKVLIPAMILFRQNNCNEYTIIDHKQSPKCLETFCVSDDKELPFTPHGVFIPFNYNKSGSTVVFSSKKITSFSENGKVEEKSTYTSTFKAPVLISDLSKTRWQTGPLSKKERPYMNKEKLKYISYAGDTWHQTVSDMCMGSVGNVGDYSLVKYAPQGAFCDDFMENTWCKDPSRLENPECGCIKDMQTDIKILSRKYGVDLPVLCFGKNCGSTSAKTYKTLNMLSKPCNLNVCQQDITAISDSKDSIIDKSKQKVFCGGTFYNNVRNVGAPEVDLIDRTSKDLPESTPFYTWILMGLSVLVFMILIFTMFRDPVKKSEDIVTELKRIKRRRKLQKKKVPDMQNN